uniref:E3 ubiquitin-protein ligase TRIM35 isoform X2 n=1 Tax=Doryrhamphus excisus TaxID=161450 RepID=UPI0025AE1F70|nr:E3 ubiquitin-protein ligase TRIM35 isoform X2 [Doryrhamphus excisus]
MCREPCCNHPSSIHFLRHLSRGCGTCPIKASPRLVARRSQRRDRPSILTFPLGYKRKMRSTIRAIQEQLENITAIKQNWEDIATHIMSQSITTTQILREEFEKMHQHLRDEEAALMSELKQEEEEKIQKVENKINKTSNDIRILTASIGELEEFMESENIFFLKNYRSTSTRTPYNVEEYKEEFGALIDVPKYQSCMQHHVWEKMLRIIHYFPVTLDPNTGSSCLVVSPDLSSLMVCDEQPLPDNPERFVNPQGILGSAGFSSGSHHWEVEVGENSQWSLGVASESVRRKDWLNLDENPVEFSGGLWTVSLSSGVYRASPGHISPLTLRKRPSRIRIQLDWERGCLTFSDANGNTLIHRFKKQWSGTLRPYFSTTCSKHPLKITEARVNVGTE